MLFALMALAGTGPLLAQGNDVITGTITGPTGAPVSGARVTAISVETELQRSATTNAQGRFTISVPDGGGVYQLSVTATGMNPVVGTLRRVGGERAQRDMDIRGSERLLPILGGVLTNIPELCRTRGHPLLERQREAVERVLRHTERLQPLEREPGADPRLLAPISRAGGVAKCGNQPP